MTDLGPMPVMNGAPMPIPGMEQPMPPPMAAPLMQYVPAPKKPLPAALQKLLDSKNIAAELDEPKRAAIAAQVCDEYDIDKQSRAQLDTWLEEASALAMLIAEDKNYPFEKASNVKYPLITTAALQFNARAYAALVQGNRVAKCVTWGEDPQGLKAARATRVSEHLSYQLLAEMPEWEEDTDRLTIILPVDGTIFRKAFYDPAVKRNVTRLVSAKRLVVNYWARSLDDVPRITEEMPLYPYEIAERIRSGRFIDFDYRAQPEGSDETKDKSQQTNAEDPDGPQLFLEQHRLLDLDEDGLQEPYIATVHKGSGQTCRLVANFDAESVTMADDGRVASIRRKNYYTKYTFIPSPDGGFYGLGFGWLLKANNEAINSTLNQMFDAGHLANMQGGFIGGTLGLKDKTLKFTRGEWKVVPVSGANLSQNIVPVKYDGPNSVMFQLLGLLIEAGKELASVKDVLTGASPATAPVGTTLALIDQGLTQFTTIYKRTHRSMKTELGMLGDLNYEHLIPEAYSRFHDAPADPKADYDKSDMDIMPISDPQSVTKMQRVAKAQAIKDIATDNDVIDQAEATKRILEAIDVEDIDKLIAPPPSPEQQTLMQRGVVAEIEEKEGKAATAKLNLLKAQQGEPMPPPPTPHELALQEMERDTKMAVRDKAALDVVNTRADIAERDVKVNEDGSVESKTEAGFAMMAQGMTQIAQMLDAALQLIATTAQQQQAAQQAGDERIIQALMSPVVPVRDAEGNMVAAQRVVN